MLRPNGIDDAFGGHCTSGTEVGRAKDRYVGDRSGILDKIADAHDVAVHGDVGAQRRHGVLRRRRIGEQTEQRRRQTDKANDGTDHCQDPPHFINCAVVCSISSAAVMTLEFIS